jgi:hypothetical protein
MSYQYRSSIADGDRDYIDRTAPLFQDAAIFYRNTDVLTDDVKNYIVGHTFDEARDTFEAVPGEYCRLGDLTRLERYLNSDAEMNHRYILTIYREQECRMFKNDNQPDRFSFSRHKRTDVTYSTDDRKRNRPPYWVIEFTHNKYFWSIKWNRFGQSHDTYKTISLWCGYDSSKFEKIEITANVLQTTSTKVYLFKALHQFYNPTIAWNNPDLPFGPKNVQLNANESPLQSAIRHWNAQINKKMEQTPYILDSQSNITDTLHQFILISNSGQKLASMNIVVHFDTQETKQILEQKAAATIISLIPAFVASYNMDIAQN